LTTFLKAQTGPTEKRQTTSKAFLVEADYALVLEFLIA
jgi:hypothetical protein